MSTTRGVLYIHSSPSALCPHIEWAVGGVFGMPVRVDWIAQPIERSAYRTEYSWAGPAGTAARLASALKGWQKLRFEVTEEATSATEGERYSYTPTLGVFHAITGIHGDIMIPEDRIRHAMVTAAARRAGPGGRPGRAARQAVGLRARAVPLRRRRRSGPLAARGRLGILALRLTPQKHRQATLSGCRLTPVPTTSPTRPSTAGWPSRPRPSGPWRLWGPYLAGRQWGTVREDYSADGDAWASFPFDHAVARAYRWGEDGLGGICDRFGFLNLGSRCGTARTRSSRSGCSA